MAIEIRALTAQDAENFRALRLEGLETSPDSFGESPEEHRRLPQDELVARLESSPNRFVLGAFEDGKLLGTAGFVRSSREKTRHRGHIWGMYVTRTVRARGVGRALLISAIERARELSGLRWLDLEVGSHNLEARTLYESVGFVKYGTEPEALFFEGRSVDNDRMTLRLI